MFKCFLLKFTVFVRNVYEFIFALSHKAIWQAQRLHQRCAQREHKGRTYGPYPFVRLLTLSTSPVIFTSNLIWFLLWSFSSHSKIFALTEDVTITSEGLKIFTFARHSWPLSSGGSLACHTFCDTGHPFIMVISEDPWHTHTYYRAFGSGAITTCFPT